MARISMLLVLAFAGVSHAAEPDAATIIQRSEAANEADWNAAPRYSYYERDMTPAGSQVYRVTMIEGSPWKELVETNGEPLPPEEQQREQRRLEEATARRRAESASERAERIAKYRKERERIRLLEKEMVRAFDFKLLGDDQTGPYDVYMLQATPKAGYRPINTEAEVLTGMKGKLWIDKQTWQWVKVRAEVVHPVTIGGFLARVQTGTQFELEKMPVGDGVWLPKHFTMTSRATVLFLFHHHSRQNVTWFDYREESAN